MKLKSARARQAGIACLFAFAFSESVRVQGQTPRSNDGAAIAARGTPSGAVACVRCHGFDGNSDGSGAFPVIAGQSEYYLAKQLRNFASGTRKNAIMSPIAARLTADEIAAVTRYYSQLPPRAVAGDESDAALIQRGMEIARTGNLPDRVEACQSCHGPNGKGEPPDIPTLAGQYAHYIVTQLQMLRRGYRKNDPGSQMRGPAHNLSEQDMSAVAAYFAQLPVQNTPSGGRRNGQ
jgi:cytochrome c553